MGKVIPVIDQKHREWIEEQKMFFVASAPLAADGHVNLSPRGGDSFRVLGEKEVVFRDLIGSGAETAAHLRENGRIVIMFCAFEGAPRIMRLHGRGENVTPKDSRFAEFDELFPAPHKGTRAFVLVQVERISTSCGFGVPLYDYVDQRTVLDDYFEKRSEEQIVEFQQEKNRVSIDGLPSYDL